MPTVMRMRWSGLTPDQYEEARQIVNWEGDPPNGARFHIAWFEEAGRPPRTALKEEVGRLAAILGRDVDAEISLAPG